MHLISSPRGGYWEIAFNSCPKTGSPICSGPGKGVKTAVVQDPAIRKAMAYAIDREKLIPTVYDGQGTTAYSLISPRFKRYFIDRKGTPLGYGFDPAKAKAVLKAGGWNCSPTPCTKNGVKAEFELDTLTSSTQFQSMARRVKADAAKVGIVVDLSFISDDALNNKIYASGTKKDLYAPNYDAFLWDWDVSGTTPTPIMEVLLSNNASSDSFYDSKAYDTALIGARTAKTPEQTVAAVRKAEAIALADLPYLPLVHLNAVELNRTDTWHGWLPAPGAGGPAAVRGRAADPRAQGRPGAGDRRGGRADRRGGEHGGRRLADDAALRPDRLDPDLARDHRVVVHQQRAQEDRAARVD